MSSIDAPHNARSRRTRQALLDATRTLVERDGFDGLTMAAAARAAGVSRRGAYLHFASRAELVTALYLHLGQTEDLPASLARVWEQPDAAAGLEEWARHIARTHPRILAVSRAIERARASDEQAAELWDHTMGNWLRSCTRLAGWLDAEGVLADGWTVESAADWLWALMSWDLLERLVVDRGWEPGRVGERYGAMLRATLVAP